MFPLEPSKNSAEYIVSMDQIVGFAGYFPMKIDDTRQVSHFALMAVDKEHIDLDTVIPNEVDLPFDKSSIGWIAFIGVHIGKG